MKNQKTILLVEDEIIIAMAEKATLEKYGYNVIISNSGENAVKDIEDSPDIDLILMDINLGSGINGTEAASRILTDHDLPVIFLSSHTERDIVEKTEGITSYGYIVKNSGETVLIAAVKMAFRLHDAKLNEKKKGEELRESEQKTRCIFDAITDAVFLHPLLKIGFAPFVEVNTTACERYGYTREEFLSLSAPEITEKTDAAVHSSIDHRKLLMEKGRLIFETTHISKSGTRIPVEINSTVITLGGKPMILAVARDITDRKNGERGPDNINLGFQDIINGINESVWVIDLDGNVMDVNNRAVETLGYSKDELISMGLPGIDSSLSEKDIRSLAASMPADAFQIFETTHRAMDGRDIPVEIYSSIVMYQGNQRILSIARDVTKRKLTEKELLRQLEEKEILLKAVHHRIKNNIASIQALLTLQAESINIPEAQSVLQDAIGRITFMKVLYENLLLTRDYKDISAKTYIKNIVDSIISLFSNNIKITTVKEIDDFNIDQSKMFPLGVIIEEIITNVMKYAFRGRESGLIRIIMREHDGSLTLTIHDNGIGLPGGFDINTSETFGLKIVKMLCQQVEADFSIETDNGTLCTLKFNM